MNDPETLAAATTQGALAACPVCRAPTPRRFLRLGGQDYWRCDTCEARFLDPHQFPALQDEYHQYRLHENDPGDPRYRKFLSKLTEPLLAKLGGGKHGLDYGCGPGPALAEVMREAGYQMELYDPFFQPDLAPLSQTFDFITCTEVAEHFHRPAQEFDCLNAMLRPGGWLGVMTCFRTDDALFANWHYRKDPTHVVFFCETTFREIARRHGWMCEFPIKDVVLLYKPEVP